MRMKYFSAFFVSFIVFCCQSAYSYETNTNLIRQKLVDPSINYQAVLNAGSNRTYHLPKERKITLRDSGRTSSLMFIKNTNFRYLGDVGFYTPQLSLSLKANNPTMPVVFDDPTSFSLHIHQGEIILSSKALNALFNTHVFNFSGATIRNVKTTTQPGVLTLQGEMFRGKWIPFTMKGKVTLKDGHLLYYTPSTVNVNGVDTTQVLAAANVKLNELLTIKAPGTELVGSTIILDANKLFPPPQLFMKITSVDIQSNGLVLKFNDGYAPKFPKSINSNTSFMAVRGGDVKFLRTMPLNASVQIDNIETGKTLDFCLYRYRDQLARGYLTLSKYGEISAHFPTPNCSY